MNQPPLNPDALDKAALAMCHYVVANREMGHGIRPVYHQYQSAKAAVSAYLAAALPEVTSVEELDQLPVGTVVYAANHIGPAEKFAVGWMGCGNNAAWSSALLARDGLPARVLYRPEVKP
ncbi:hypothetical protein [Glutamicibacter protophormiae]|uniref:hypothetical protein n=1 Tax=Glutamicibacter protophormiae TaxID=37930 RepID=UPI003A95C474